MADTPSNINLPTNEEPTPYLSTSPSIEIADLTPIEHFEDIPAPKPIKNEFAGQSAALVGKIREGAGMAERVAAEDAFSQNLAQWYTNSVSDDKKTFVTNDVPLDEVYTRLNSGKYLKKYKNYTPGTDNEDRLAKEQGVIEQALYGGGKFFAKTFANVLDGTIGTGVGIYEFAKEGRVSALWDNGFSKWIDDLNKEADGALPNYYTEEQRNMGWFRSAFTTNFWANDFLGGMSFLTGTVGSEAIWAGLTGGASLAAAAPRIAAKAPGRLGKAVRFFEGAAEKVGVKKMFNAYERTVPIGRLGKGANNARFFWTSSGYEAGVESRHSLDESLENFKASYETTYGKLPTADDYARFMEDALPAANAVFFGNMALVGGSNIIMLGGAFKAFQPLLKAPKKAMDRAFGMGLRKEITDEGFKYVARTQSKLQKRSYQAALVAQPIVTEGFMEEGGQSVISGTSGEWLGSRHNPDALQKNMSIVDALGKSLKSTYGTNEGWKEIFLGSLIGTAGSWISPDDTGKRRFLSRGYIKAKQKQYEEEAGTINERIKTFTTSTQDLMERLAKTNQVQTYVERSKQKMDAGDHVGSSVDWDIATFSKMNAEHGAGMLDDSLESAYHVIDNMDTKSLQTNYGISAEDASQLQEAMKRNFKKEKALFEKSMEIAEYHGFKGRAKLPEDKMPAWAKGKPHELESLYKQELAFNLFMGAKTDDRAKDLGDRIADFVNRGKFQGGVGAHSYMDVYQKLDEEGRQTLEEYNTLRDEVEGLEKEYAEIQQEFAQYPTGQQDKTIVEKIKKKEEEGNKKKAELFEKRKKLDGLYTKIEAFSGKIVKDYDRTADSADGDLVWGSELGMGAEYTADEVVAAYNAIKDLDVYRQQLRESGKNEQADYLDGLVADYILTLKHREVFTQTYKGMTDPKYDITAYEGLTRVFASFGKSLEDGELKDILEVIPKGDLKKFNNYLEANEDKLSDSDKHTLWMLLLLKAGGKDQTERIRNLEKTGGIPRSEQSAFRQTNPVISQARVDALAAKVSRREKPSLLEYEMIKHLGDNELDRWKQAQEEYLRTVGDNPFNVAVETPLAESMPEDTPAQKLAKKIQTALERHNHLRNKMSTETMDDSIQLTEEELEEYNQLKARAEGEVSSLLFEDIGEPVSEEKQAQIAEDIASIEAETVRIKQKLGELQQEKRDLEKQIEDLENTPPPPPPPPATPPVTPPATPPVTPPATPPVTPPAAPPEGDGKDLKDKLEEVRKEKEDKKGSLKKDAKERIDNLKEDKVDERDRKVEEGYNKEIEAINKKESEGVKQVERKLEEDVKALESSSKPSKPKPVGESFYLAGFTKGRGGAPMFTSQRLVDNPSGKQYLKATVDGDEAQVELFDAKKGFSVKDTYLKPIFDLQYSPNEENYVVAEPAIFKRDSATNNWRLHKKGLIIPRDSEDVTPSLQDQKKQLEDKAAENIQSVKKRANLEREKAEKKYRQEKEKLQKEKETIDFEKQKIAQEVNEKIERIDADAQKKERELREEEDRKQLQEGLKTVALEEKEKSLDKIDSEGVDPKIEEERKRKQDKVKEDSKLTQDKIEEEKKEQDLDEEVEDDALSEQKETPVEQRVDSKDGRVRFEGVSPTDWVGVEVDQLLEELSKLKTVPEKLGWLREKGLISTISIEGEESDGLVISDRETVFVKIGGMSIPFYVSTGRGRKEGVPVKKWYPIFGWGENSGWFNKGLYFDEKGDYLGKLEIERLIADNYGVGLFQKIAEVLNEGVGADSFTESTGEAVPGVRKLSGREVGIHATLNKQLNLESTPSDLKRFDSTKEGIAQQRLHIEKTHKHNLATIEQVKKEIVKLNDTKDTPPVGTVQEEQGGDVVDEMPKEEREVLSEAVESQDSEIIEEQLVSSNIATRAVVSAVKQELNKFATNFKEVVQNYLKKGVSALSKFSKAVVNLVKKYVIHMSLFLTVMGGVKAGFSSYTFDNSDIVKTFSTLSSIRQGYQSLNLSEGSMNTLRDISVASNISVEANILILLDKYSRGAVLNAQERQLAEELFAHYPEVDTKVVDFSYLEKIPLAKSDTKLGFCVAKKECAEYVIDVFQATPALLNVLPDLAIYGDAWRLPTFIVTGGGGQFMYNYFDNNPISEINSVDDILAAIDRQDHSDMGNYLPDEGDVVGLFYRGSGSHQKAWDANKDPQWKINAYNTHVGFIRYVDGVAYIEHNVDGTIIREPYNDVIRGKTTSGIKVATVARPAFPQLVDEIETGTPGIGIIPNIPEEHLYKHWDRGQGSSLEANVILNTVQSELSNRNMSQEDRNLITAVVYVLSGQESSFGTDMTRLKEHYLVNKGKGVAGEGSLKVFGKEIGTPSHGVFQVQKQLLDKAGIRYKESDFYDIQKSTKLAIKLVDYYKEGLENSSDFEVYQSLTFSQKVALFAYVHNRGLENYTGEGALDNIIDRMLVGGLYQPAVYRTNYLSYPGVDNVKERELSIKSDGEILEATDRVLNADKVDTSAEVTPPIKGGKGFKILMEDTQLSASTRRVMRFIERAFPSISDNVVFHSDQKTWDKYVGDDSLGGNYVTDDESGQIHIFLNPKSYNDVTVLHEVVHAFTNVIIKNPRTERERAYVNTIKKLFADFKKYEGAADFLDGYVFNDIEEFITYTMTNTAFQDFLNSNESTKGSFRRFLDFIKRLFGIPTSMVDKVIRATEGVVTTTDYSDIRQRILETGAEAKGQKKTTKEQIDDLRKRVQEIDAQIADLGTQIDDLNSRYDELLKQQQKPPEVEEVDDFEEVSFEGDEGLTPEEVIRLEELAQKINTWGSLRGTEEGDRPLSDMISELVELRKLEAANREKVLVVPGVEPKAYRQDRAKRDYSNVGQSYDKVLISKDRDGNFVIHHTKAGEFFTSLGLSKPKFRIGDTAAKITVDGKSYSVNWDSRGNIVITEKLAKVLEEKHGLLFSLIGHSGDLVPTAYTPLYRENGDPIDSDFQIDGEDMVNEVIEEKNVGDSVVFTVEAPQGRPGDNSFLNNGLLREYRKTKEALDAETTDEGRVKKQGELDKIAEKLANLLVIKVKDSDGNFISVLKSGKNRGRGRVSREAGKQNQKLNRLRVVAAHRFIEHFVNNGQTTPIDLQVEATISQVFWGHPNLKIKRNDDGSFTHGTFEITDRVSRQIEDVGYLEDGKVTLKNAGEYTEGKYPYITAMTNNGIDKGKRVPVVLINYKGKQVLFPAGMNMQTVDLSTQFEEVMASDLPPFRKSLAVNKMLHDSGYDLNIDGVTFEQLSDSNVVDEVKEKLQNGKSLPDYMAALRDKDVTAQQIAKDSLNLPVDFEKQPTHSPKLAFNWKDVNVPAVESTAPDVEAPASAEEAKSEMCKP